MKHLTNFLNQLLPGKAQPLKRIVLPAVVFIIVSCGATVQVHADAVIIDQSNTPQPNFGLSIQGFSPIGQEFTPTLTSLNFVDLLTRDFGGGLGATLRVHIRLGSIAGAIVGTSSDLVLPDGFGSGGLGVVTSFTFGTPVTLVPGNLYVIQPVVEAGDNWSLAGNNSFNSYPGGRAISRGIVLPNADFYFVEGVRTADAVPEPTTMLLLGTGLVGIAAKMRKRRKSV